jgi:hypothetical protein
MGRRLGGSEWPFVFDAYFFSGKILEDGEGTSLR